MRQILSVLFTIILWALPAAGQERAWLQVEAQPTLREARERARVYAAAFPDVNGFRLNTGWYAIALGPYTPETAAIRLRDLRRDRLIPGDSYISDGANFIRRFWPVGVDSLAITPTRPTANPEPPAPDATTTVLPRETPAEARRNERRLSAAERDLLQKALRWEGFYQGAIDGDFGPGTRGAMRDWQAANGHEATGILTTRQRSDLIEGYRADFAALGLGTVDDAEAGIRITMPTKMVEFARYVPPFAHYDNTAGNGVRVLLISQQGDETTLSGLYDIMQTLEIVPMTGARERDRNSFVLTGQNARLHSYTYAALRDGRIKGFTLTWEPADARRMNKVAEIMRDSFTPYGDKVLDESLGNATAGQGVDLMAGLDIRRPQMSRSGFYVDAAGTVLTTAEILNQCRRITIGNEVEARIGARDDALGLAVLRPAQTLAPIAHAAFRTDPPRLQSEVAVAGFPYGPALSMPVLTYGTLNALRGLNGEAALNRLSMATLPGDAGGPVFDANGAVLGILLADPEGARRLPDNVDLAASVPAIAELLSANGVEMTAADRAGKMAPEDLTELAANLTVMVNCWN